MRMLEWICVLIKNTSHHLHFIFLSIVSAVHSCGWMYKTTHCSQIYKRCWHTRFFFIDLWDACCSFSGSIFYFGLLLEYFLYALTLKTHQFSQTVQRSSSVWNSLFSSPQPPKYPACSDWSAHTRLNQHCSPSLRSALLCFHLPVNLTSFSKYRYKLCICVTWWRGLMKKLN